MSQKKQVSRYEINRLVKQVLVRYAVDLTELQFSCSGETVYLYGNLFKDSEGAFTPLGIETLVKELSRLPFVKQLQWDLNNWYISGELGSWQITKRR